MNASFLLNKVPILFILLLCFVISFSETEATRTIRIRKIRTHVAPRHITISARSGNGVYARRYVYGRPLPRYNTNAIIGSNRRYYASRTGNGKRNVYASRYRNWTPNRNQYGGRYNPRADRIGLHKKRKDLLPFLVEPPFSNKHKRRVRPFRPNPIQKPRPPKRPNEFDEDYFFPEESKRPENKYEFENRYPRPKKKRRPDFEAVYKKPEFKPKIPYYDEKPLSFKSKPRDPAFSYSSFVRHPSDFSDDSEDTYEEPDTYSQTLRKKKKNKKKSNTRKKNKDQFKPFVFEDEQSDESYPHSNEYELPSKRYKKRNKPNYEELDDEFSPSRATLYSKPRPQSNTLFNTESDYRVAQTNPQSTQFSPTYSQTWSQPVQTTARPVQFQNENGFQPQYNYNPNQYKDYSSLQKIKTVTNTQQSTYYSQPDNTYKTSYNYASNQISNTPNNYINNQISNTPSNFNYQQSYSQPIQSSSSGLTDVTIQKSVPIYDNTETFYNFNNNAYVNSQSSKYYNQDQDINKSYGTRINQNYRNKVGDKTDSDSEFIKKHQNLYNNGLSGVPIQGDGYAKESTKKDYDIGYGDFQFDENPSS